MYYIYHIPGKKIGATSNLKTRVTLMQGYKEGEYEVLHTSENIDEISALEIELQKSYGYKVDRQSYKDLINKNNQMEVNVTEQTTTFPVPRKQLKGRLMDQIGMKWQTPLGEFSIDLNSVQWLEKNANVSMFNDKRCFVYNKAAAEYFKTRNITNECLADGNYIGGLTMPKKSEPAAVKPVKELKIFKKIRQWATDRGLYVSGDPITQYVKLQEEAGELAQALLKDDQPEVIDAIGDMVVVLTNLAHQRGVSIEKCINDAYKVISKRKGKMINGTFVKETL
tara:strand:- start:394 stop:1236 length:843 start_codon:yes stop_codon:yes gene_type:complete